MVILALAMIFAVVPLLGIAWTVESGSLTTVDGLFTSLILLALSGILFLNVALEVRKKFRKAEKKS